ncbi:MAG: Rrf2 family transcriptional regulator [Planctomycetia bacterium]|nr:Rrf2 family transcriptional regulator [Planctomycetia bacterium]
MKLSAKAEYACLAVLELALRHDRSEPARLVEIAAPNAIPERFLVQILLQLKGAGFVSSVRGAAGGYRLAVEPHEISVWDIVQNVEGPTAPAADEAGGAGPGWRVLRKVWNETNRIEQEHLQQIDFAHLAEVARAQNANNMYYI